MRVTEYDWVFDAWELPQGWLDWGWAPITYESLSYVQFWLVTVGYAVVVRCDPCSPDQDRTAYAAMVRMDLEQALAKARRSVVEFVAPGRDEMPDGPRAQPHREDPAASDRWGTA
jgi:hypothetical protein